MNRENVLAVAQAIEDAAKPGARSRLGFNMNDFVATGDDQTGHQCGTTACIGGWALFLRGGRRFSALRDISSIDASDWLGLAPAVGSELFYAGASPLTYDEITPAHAVAVLRHLANTGVVDWSVGAPS